MTKAKSNPIKAAHKPLKKADPIAGFKSSIMIASIAGTMTGWLLLVDQETAPLSVNTAIPESNEIAAAAPTGVDINQLRQVNDVQTAPVAAIPVVARTRSSR